MKLDQLQQTLGYLRSLEEMNHAQAIAEAYPTENLDELALGGYTAAQFIERLKRTIDNLKAAFEGPDAQAFPRAVAPSTNQWYDIASLANNLVSQCRNHQYRDASETVRLMVMYQINTGIWNTEPRRTVSPSRVSRNVLLSNLEAITHQHTIGLADLAKSALSLKEDLASRQSELSEIESEVVNMRALRGQATDLLTATTRAQSQAESLLASMRTQLEADTEDIATTKKNLDERVQAMANAEHQLKQIEENALDVTARKDEVYELLGKAAAGALSGSFEARRKSIHSAKLIWAVASLLLVVGSCWWIYFMNSKLIAHAQGDSIWLYLLQKVGILLPVAFSLGYAAAQYARERTLEEEYAFRAAVAKTMVPFGEEVERSKSVVEKRQLLSDTIEKLYSTPSAMRERDHGFLLFRSKPLAEALQSLTELIKTLKP